MAEILDWFKKNNWLVIGMALVLSFVYPQIGIAIRPYINVLLIMLVFLSCLDIKVGEIIRAFKESRSQVGVLAITHLISPLLILPFQFVLPKEVYLGLIITAVSPVARSTVFLSNIYGGYPAKALVSSTVSNAFSPIIIPILVWIFAHTIVKVDVMGMGSTIFWLVAVPLAAAYFVGKTKVGKNINKGSSGISVIVLATLMMGIIAPVRDVMFEHKMYSLVVAFVAVYCLTADFLMGYKLAKGWHNQMTFGVTSAYKNYTLATILTMTMAVADPVIALGPIIFSVMNNLLLIPLSLFYRKRISVVEST